MKTVGIIGGLGPETTAKFYLEIISSCAKLNKEARPSILVWNVPIPFKTEENLILRGEGQADYLPFLLDGAKRLERAGADFLVMPCNSVHIFIDEIRNAIKIPVLSIVDETIKSVKKQRIKKVGILATSITLDNKLFQKSLEKHRVSFGIPDADDQLKLGKIILNILSGNPMNRDKKEVTEIIKDMKTDALILACTDLQLIMQKTEDVKIIDTMKVLADATVREIV